MDIPVFPQENGPPSGIVAVVDSPSHGNDSQASWWALVLVVLSIPFLPLVLIALWIPGVIPRLTVMGGLAALALMVRVTARRRWPRSLAVFAWLLPYGLMVWAGWSAAGWAEAIEYRADCTSRWNSGAAQISGSVPSHDRAAYVRDCIRAQRAAADQRSREPDARCVMMEDSSGCPQAALRRPWLAVSGAVAAVGLAVTLARWASIRSAAPVPSVL